MKAHWDFLKEEMAQKLVTPLATVYYIFSQIGCLKHGLYFGIIWLGNCFGYFSKNIGQFFSESSGHPAQNLNVVCQYSRLGSARPYRHPEVSFQVLRRPSDSRVPKCNLPIARWVLESTSNTRGRKITPQIMTLPLR